MTPAEERVLTLSIEVMEATAGLDVTLARHVGALRDVELEWGAAVRDLMSEREQAS